MEALKRSLGQSGGERRKPATKSAPRCREEGDRPRKAPGQEARLTR